MVRTETGRAFSLSSSAMAEGTVLISVISAPGGPDSSARASSTRTTVPPQARVTKISNTDRSNVTAVEARTPRSSSGENAVRAQWANTTALAWLTATALGRPVDPDV